MLRIERRNWADQGPRRLAMRSATAERADSGHVATAALQRLRARSDGRTPRRAQISRTMARRSRSRRPRAGASLRGRGPSRERAAGHTGSPQIASSGSAIGMATASGSASAGPLPVLSRCRSCRAARRSTGPHTGRGRRRRGPRRVRRRGPARRWRRSPPACAARDASGTRCRRRCRRAAPRCRAGTRAAPVRARPRPGTMPGSRRGSARGCGLVGTRRGKSLARRSNFRTPDRKSRANHWIAVLVRSV